MKKIYYLLTAQFLRTFTLTFLISVFIFLMIFIFVYIDEFIGKNIESAQLLKLFSLFALNTVPRALPLAILLASVMTIGTHAEHFEISAIKSAGISFSKMLRPLFACAVIFAFILFIFSNVILPRISLVISQTMHSIRVSRPTVLFREGSFSSEIPGVTFKIGSIAADGHSFKDIIIYDHSEDNGNTTVITADSGSIEEARDSEAIIFVLHNGHAYRELSDSTDNITTSHVREAFEAKTVRIDLHQDRNDLYFGRSAHVSINMLNMAQIDNYIDSLQTENRLLMRGKEKSNESVINKIALNEDAILVSRMEWHRRIALSFSCLLMFIIGAPMGNIIRRGGLGLPMVVCTLVYILYHTLTIVGEKLAEDGVVNPFTGIWLSAMILLPPAIFLFSAAARDRTSFELPGFRKNKK
jgi:lipopolysaccharide export system permease protein